MANGFYQYGMQAFAQGAVVWKASGGSNVRTALVDTADYTVDLAAHNFMDDVAAGSREETSSNMTLIDAAVDGIVDANDVTFTGTSGDQCEGIIVYKFVTNDADSIPLFWWDSATGLPVTLGGDVTVAWDSGTNKIAKI
jgi:hypothetical protein